MTWLLLAIACSIGVATVFKATERRHLDRAALLAANYAAGALLALALQGTDVAGGRAAVDAGLVALGVAQGVLFIAGFWLFSFAIGRAGMGLAAGVMRLSVVVPVVAAWAVWGEPVSPTQMAGLALAGAAFFLVARPAADDAGPSAQLGGGRTFGALALLFLAGGLVDVLNMAFTEIYAATADASLFLLFVFAVAFAVGATAVVATGVRTGRWPRRETVLWGVGLGVINYASADFFLRAIEQLPAPFVFPANSVAIVFGAALVGQVGWQERLSPANWAGLAVAAVALVLLAQ